jgi:class 3 adenylate cyclase
MPDLPSGTVTFLFTDIEGSTALLERDRRSMASAVEWHTALLYVAIREHGGSTSRRSAMRCNPPSRPLPMLLPPLSLPSERFLPGTGSRSVRYTCEWDCTWARPSRMYAGITSRYR